MKRVQCFLAAAIITSFAIIASAQSKPSFAGHWTTEPDPATTAPVSPAPATPAPAPGGRAGEAPGGQRAAGPGRGGGRGDMGSGWGSTITITQDASKLVVEYAFFGRGDMQPPLKFVYALDGSETRNSVMMGRGIQGQASTTAWEGDKLVVTTIHLFADPESGKTVNAEVKQLLSLESPTSLVVETTRSATLGGPANTTRTVYRKL